MRQSNARRDTDQTAPRAHHLIRRARLIHWSVSNDPGPALIRTPLDQQHLQLRCDPACVERPPDRPSASSTHLAKRAERGAQYERIVAGTQGQSRMFWASCRALARYFFERARPVCEQAIGSVRVTGL